MCVCMYVHVCVCNNYNLKIRDHEFEKKWEGHKRNQRKESGGML